MSDERRTMDAKAIGEQKRGVRPEPPTSVPNVPTPTPPPGPEKHQVYGAVDQRDEQIDKAYRLLERVHAIPFYAYGDNQAAVEMADAIDAALGELLAAMQGPVANAAPAPCPACNDDGVIHNHQGDKLGPCDVCAPASSDAAPERRAPDELRYGWPTYYGVTVVECPSCGFTMGAEFTDEEDGKVTGYSCPLCQITLDHVARQKHQALSTTDRRPIGEAEEDAFWERLTEREHAILEADFVDGTAREILCRVFDDDIEHVMQQWREWYKPEQWLSARRALGGFIYWKLQAQKDGAFETGD